MPHLVQRSPTTKIVHKNSNFRALLVKQIVGYQPRGVEGSGPERGNGDGVYRVRERERRIRNRRRDRRCRREGIVWRCISHCSCR